MPDPVRLEKAELIEIDANDNPVQPEVRTRVQFNPETLKVSFANQLKTPADDGGTAALQFVGSGTTKLSVQLWFDVTAPQVVQAGEPQAGKSKINDVRKLTQRVAYFITPRETSRGSKKMVPPITRFMWGTFAFDGIMESLEESLEMFSPDGRPLRASVTLGLTQQRITFSFFDEKEGQKRIRPRKVGTKPMAQATSKSTVQSLASNAGKGDDWQDIAAANGIENPRELKPGQVIDLNPKLPPPGTRR